MSNNNPQDPNTNNENLVRGQNNPESRPVPDNYNPILGEQQPEFENPYQENGNSQTAQPIPAQQGDDNYAPQKSNKTIITITAAILVIIFVLIAAGSCMVATNQEKSSKASGQSTLNKQNPRS